MDSSAELRAKRAGFLARFNISVPKFSKQERSVLEVSYHHQQQKDSFRLDRIKDVRHHIVDPVPGNTVADETKDDGFFLIASKTYHKVMHRRHLTSEELIVEAKKGNLTRCPVLPILETEKHIRVQNAGSDQVSTASAQDSVASGVTTHASVRSSTKSAMPCKQRRNIARAAMHAEKRKLSSLDDDISLKGNSTEAEVKRRPCMEQSVQRNENLLSLNDLASLMEDMPDFTREQLLHSISETIVNFMAPVRSRSMEPLEEPEPHGGVFGVCARVSQPYSSTGGTREDLRVVPDLETQVEVFGDCHHVSQPYCVIGDTQEECHGKV
jgi:hypothetical protein